MGSEKALLVVDGRPLVAHHVHRYLQVCRRLVVVVRPEISRRVRAALGPLATESVQILPVRTASPAESLARGVEELAGGPLLVTPVDLLPCRLDTLARLTSALGGPGVLAATPSHGGRGGHPVLLQSELLDSYRRASVESRPTLRQLLESAGASRVRVEVDDPRVLGDFDTPRDIREIALGPPRG